MDVASAPSVAIALIKLRNVIDQPSFHQTVSDFTSQYCCEFEEGDENMLTYTGLHQKYIDLVSGHITDALDDETFAVLIEELVPYLTTKGEDLGDSVGSSIYYLSTLVDFQMFKAMMLMARREKTADMKVEEGGSLDHTAEEDRFLLEATQFPGPGQWKEVSRSRTQATFHRIADDKKSTRIWKGESLVLASPEAVLMSLTGGDDPDYCKWMPLASDVSVDKRYAPEDFEFSHKISREGFMAVLAAFASGRQYYRCRRFRNFPSEGDVSFRFSSLADGSPMKDVTGICKHVQGDTSKCRLTLVVEPAAYIPSWASKIVVTRMIPAVIGMAATKYTKIKGC